MARTTARTLPLLFGVALLGASCGTRHEVVHSGDPAGDSGDSAYEESSGYDSQSARTQAMEDRAAELEQRYREAMADENASEQDKIRAYQEFERERQKLNEMAESSGEDNASDDDY
jgi:hypothetical protein